ncbi:unnamed protein product [Cuscuta epithymum]|uniref:Uncharacterized protein n=1 Tax=Cuscuta epithymum TaxID=186058 RepID=A0AAV0EAV8_9ASTE|nr:unnamed protein product [Cuscuta epithymum]
MGSVVFTDMEAFLIPSSIKVHLLMCTTLINIVSKASRILGAIESTRPRCRSGMESLCSLNKAIEELKSIIKQCTQSSKLYLALRGDIIHSRCIRSRRLMEASLDDIQNMVPLSLASQVCELGADLRGATFIIEGAEEEAAKAVKEILYNQFVTKSEVEEWIKVAMSRLNINSPKALLVEKKSITMMLHNLGDGQKKTILTFLLHLLRKHGKQIVETYSSQE